MTDAGKLEALVRRAFKNGWDDSRFFVGSSPERQAAEGYEIWAHYSKNDFLFNHDFARALFGDSIVQKPVGQLTDDGMVYRMEDMYEDERGDLQVKPTLLAWQHHLQQAVISKDPISYMYKAVFGE